MTEIYEYAGMAVVLFWVAFRVVFPFVSLKIALAVSGALLCALGLFASEAVFMVIAVLAPFGALLPALALQNVAGKCREQLSAPCFPTLELVLILVVYVAFMSASLGVFTFDPYRYGYSAATGSVIAFAACGYALWRGYFFIACALVLGQIAWSFDIGSRNCIDHMTHAILVPVIVIVLGKRAFLAGKARLSNRA